MLIVQLFGWSTLFADEWPGWRGNSRSGVSSETEIPTEWSVENGVRWKTPLIGAGISGPVIWGDQVFLSASDGPQHSQLHLVSLSVREGRELWHLRLWGTTPTRCHGQKSTMASPTPITDGSVVYAFYGTGDVFAADKAGGLLWQRSLASEFGPFENRFAASSSPLLYKDTLLIQCDHYGDSYLIALDCKTGSTRWKVDRPETWLSWSSPILAPVPGSGRKELVVCSSLKIDAFDPLSGGKLWTVDGMQRECIPTPVLGHGLIYAVSGPSGATLAIRPGGTGDVTESHIKWRKVRGAPFVPSAILVGDHYYLVDDKGIATCLDAHTGNHLWQARLPGRYTASPVAAGDKVYFINESGTTVVMQAGTTEYKELARNDLSEPVFASPAIADGRIYIRSSAHIYCIE